MCSCQGSHEGSCLNPVAHRATISQGELAQSRPGKTYKYGPSPPPFHFFPPFFSILVLGLYACQ